MKLLFTILTLLILVALYNCSMRNENKLTGSWVAFKTEGFNTDSYWSKNGYIFDFKNGVVNINHIFSDSTISRTYTISDSTIILGDSTILRVYQIFTDSIKLVFDNQSLVTFRKLPFSDSRKYQIDEREILNSSWLYCDENYSQRIEFLDHEWIHHDDATYECYTHELKDTLYYDSSLNKWRIFEYKVRTYFVRTFSTHHGLLHEIIKISNDTIYTKAWIGYRYSNPFLKKIKNAPKPIIEKTITTLTNKTWNVKDIDYSSNELPEWEIEIITKRINLVVIKGEMKFDFTKDSLNIFNNDSSIMHSNWRLTNDGKYITFKTKNQTHFVEIINYNDSLITLKNNTTFTYLMSLMNFSKIEYILTLE